MGRFVKEKVKFVLVLFEIEQLCPPLDFWSNIITHVVILLYDRFANGEDINGVKV